MATPRRSLARVAPGVFVATSRQDATTSTVVISDAHPPEPSDAGTAALLVDPAWLPGELDGLAGELAHRGIRVTAGFSTHAHHDHLLWHHGFGDAARWASPATCALARQHREALLADLGKDWPDRLKPNFARVTPLTGNMIPEPFGAAGDAEAIEVVMHDGHAPGHSALWLPERRVLIAGDMLSDRELPLPFSPDDLPAYLRALETLAPYVRQAQMLIPGHGTPTTDPTSRLDADQRYLDSILAGTEADDPRRNNPGMTAIHARILEMVRRLL
ncbi:MBL fold metallo-hydrolase [Homoserinimonas sp. OAct 916]|uniref:MBL fold metallo-hydrolase n=1 Tax=Homoserinimonas sp. OAct 916 TaxID=2211450 RepID=UPI000DBDFF96|nr:MBL fold metallo-hydrolase [Homoserinimonas sp. OAct 916]